MDVITHTFLAGLAMAGCYCWGRYLSKYELLEMAVEKVLVRLESEGFIRTAKDKDGDVVLVPISEIEQKIMNDMR